MEFECVNMVLYIYDKRNYYVFSNSHKEFFCFVFTLF